MKIKFLIPVCLLLCCNNYKEDVNLNLIEKEVFINILKEIHLYEASYELKKSNALQVQKDILANNYKKLYLKYGTNKQEFEKTLSYYSSSPDEIEIIYAEIINNLTNEKDSLSL